MRHLLALKITPANEQEWSQVTMWSVRLHEPNLAMGCSQRILNVKSIRLDVVEL